MKAELFAVSTPGLEPVTADELRALGLPAEISQGGVTTRGTLHDVTRLNAGLRTASRLLQRVGRFRATTFPALRRETAALPWERFLARDGAVALRVTCRKSRLHHSGAVAERVLGGIADRIGVSPHTAKPVEDPAEDGPQLVVVRFEDDEATLSVDTSGALLHRRGYRQETAKAPLRETLAAAMVLLSGWDRVSPLVDPFCGSGTLLCEADAIARGRLPGADRMFAWQRWPCARGIRVVVPPEGAAGAPLFGNDHDAGAIRAATGNAARAGAAVNFTQADATALLPPAAGPGWIITNPPWGVRVDTNRPLTALYARVGAHWRARWPGWRVCLLAPGALAQATGIAWERVTPVVNGGVRVEVRVGRA
ncbi:MAG: class I SAM-dependent RNA methyltransferase [Deltaproteobacteria bacterium]|nr:class I SAM-dependent RNA methyltransferase [Deltaproteobacteria bacterium]